MMTSSNNGNLFRVTGLLCGEFTGHRWIPPQRPVTRMFGVFIHLCLNKGLSKQSWGWWFETPSRSLGRHCNEIGLSMGNVTWPPIKSVNGSCNSGVVNWKRILDHLKCKMDFKNTSTGTSVHFSVFWQVMTSSNGNIFRVSGPLCGEFVGHRWIPHTKASDAEF